MRNLMILDGDLVVSKGDVLLVEGDAELAQALRTLLSTALGEWVLDEEVGLDRNPFENKPYNEEEIRTALVEAIMSEPRIESVRETTLHLDRSQRLLTIDFKAVKEDGTTLQFEGVEMNGG